MNDKRKKSVPILPARFRFHKIDALLKAHRESKLEPPKRKKLKFSDPALYRPLACPLCSEMLDVYRRSLGDEWACCPGCGFSDDVPGTVALSLGCTLAEALDFLVFQHNLHHVSKKEIDGYLEEKARYDRFAELVRERLYHDYSLNNPEATHGIAEKTLYRFLDTLNLQSQIGGDPDFIISLSKKDRIREPERLNEARDTDPRRPDHVSYRELPSWHASDFFGFAYASVVESWFFPNLYDPEDGSVWINTSPGRLFHGGDWDIVLVIPLQDVPGHYCGILCVGRDGEYPDDYVIRLFPHYDRRSTNTGFILPFWAYRKLRRLKCLENDEEIEPEDKVETFMIAYNNPLHLIRTTIQSASFPVPPLFGWVDYFENAPHLNTSDWSPFEQIRNKIFWIQRYDARTMRTIIRQDGQVLPYDMESPYPGVEEYGNFGHPPFRPNPFAVVRMEIDGFPWPEFMAERFKYFAPMEAVEELRRIAMNSKRFDEILDRLPETPETKTIRRFAKSPDDSVHIRIGQYDIFEEPAGWMRKTDRQMSLRLVSDVRCYIDQLLLDRRGVKKLYRGRIVYDDRTFPFRVTVERFEKDAIGFLQAVLRKRNLPTPAFHCKNRLYKAIVKELSEMKKARMPPPRRKKCPRVDSKRPGS